MLLRLANAADRSADGPQRGHADATRRKRISADRLAVSVRDQPNLLQYVFIQEQVGQVRAQLRFRNEPDPGDLEALEQRLREAAGGETAIHIELVQEIRQGYKFKALRLQAIADPAPWGIRGDQRIRWRSEGQPDVTREIRRSEGSERSERSEAIRGTA